MKLKGILKKVGLIGYGAMAQTVLELLAQDNMPNVDIVGIIKPNTNIKPLQSLTGKPIPVTDSIAEFLSFKPDLVAECATQSAVKEHGIAVLEAGIDLVVISIGALADPEFLNQLVSAAENSGARLILPAGALGAVDVLGAARLGQLDKVTQSLAKPPRSWKGTPAEQVADLDTLSEPVVVFAGSAGEAARIYPQNANVAAVAAMAGIGFEKSTITLIADPGLSGPVHHVEAEGSFGSLKIELKGVSLPGNPKSSSLAALSVARAIVNEAATVII